MKALLLACGLIVTILSFLSILYNYISCDEDEGPNAIQNVLMFPMVVVGLCLLFSSTEGRFTGVHDTRSDVYIITDIEEQFEHGQFIAKYKAKSYDTEHRIHETGVDIQFYDALQKFHVGDTLKLVK
jgi:hypothetical protein